MMWDNIHVHVGRYTMYNMGEDIINLLEIKLFITISVFIIRISFFATLLGHKVYHLFFKLEFLLTF